MHFCTNCILGASFDPNLFLNQDNAGEAQADAVAGPSGFRPGNVAANASDRELLSPLMGNSKSQFVLKCYQKISCRKH